MTDTIWKPTHAELESLFVNNPSIDGLEAHLNHFNPIRVMRMEGIEVRHSNILAWLLDPMETHGLGDRFLKALLAEALKGESAKGKPSAIDIIQADLRDIEVRREWQHIDLFLLSRRNNWAFVVENKFHASQYAGQLSKYIQKVRSAFEPEEGKLAVKGIFLTLHDEEPEDLSYAAIGYDALSTLLPQVMAADGFSISPQVRTFLEHYIEVIEEAAGMSEDLEQMQELARSLYRQHRKVLDFIWEHGSTTNFSLALDECFGDGWADKETLKLGKLNLVPLWSAGENFSFLPAAWHEQFGGDEHDWPGCEKWWSGYPMICWLQLFPGVKGNEGTLRLFAEVGPLSDIDGRRWLIESIQSAAKAGQIDHVRFQRTATNQGKKFSKFLKDNSISVKDVQDVEEIAKGIQMLLKKFQPIFEAISTALDGVTDYAEVSSND